MESLASLPVGTAWVWSPGYLELFQRVTIRARETFDSSATPKAGAWPVEPSAWVARTVYVPSGARRLPDQRDVPIARDAGAPPTVVGRPEDAAVADHDDPPGR
jgi:hypothetical protein